MLTTAKRVIGKTFRRCVRNRYSRAIDSWANLPHKQALTNLSDNPIAFHETPTGRYYLPTNAPGDVIIKAIVQGKIFEPEVIATAEEFIKPGSTVLDIGANLGQMCLQFARLATPEGHVHAFEADPFIHSLLEKNLAANGCKNTTAHLGAVYDEEGTFKVYPVQDFKRFSAYGSYGIDPQAIDGRRVPTVTIDSLRIQTPISFAKIDIQGSDLFAMRGAIETIKRHRMAILFEFEQQFQQEFQTSFQDYVSFVDSIGYRFDRVVMDINYLILPR